MLSILNKVWKPCAEFLSDFWRAWRGYAGHWQKLGKFFSTSAIRFFIFWFAAAPIVVGIISDLPDHIIVEMANINYTINLDLPFNWKILWLSSFLYAAAFLIYQLRCPEFIKDNPNLATYFSYKHSPRWLTWLTYYGWIGIPDKDKLADRLIEKSLAIEVDNESEIIEKPIVKKEGTIWHFAYKEKKYEVCINENTSEKVQSEFFWEIFGRWAASRSTSRNTIWLLVSAAILLTGLVAIQNILSVIIYITGM